MLLKRKIIIKNKKKHHHHKKQKKQQPPSGEGAPNEIGNSLEENGADASQSEATDGVASENEHIENGDISHAPMLQHRQGSKDSGQDDEGWQ